MNFANHKPILFLIIVFALCATKPTSAQTYNNPVIIASTPWARCDMAIDSAGNLFFCGYQYISGVTDGRIYEIKKTPAGYDPSPILIASGLGAAWELVIDPKNNIFSLDVSSGRIFKTASLGGGSYATPVVITTGLGNSCQGLAMDRSNGNLYSVGLYPKAVFEIPNIAGVYNSTPNILATYSIGSFEDVAIDKSGNLFIVGFFNTLYTLPKVNGVYSTTISPISTNLNNPTGINIDDCGNLFVCNQGNNTIYEMLKTAAGYNPSPVSISSIPIPTFVIPDKEGNLFSNNTYTGDIYMIRKNNPGVLISTPSLQVCANNDVTFTASTSNSSIAPFEYHWKKNGKDVGTNNSFYSDNTFSNNDVIQCELVGTSTCFTVTSNTLAMSVTSTQQLSISISANSNAVCAGSTIVFNAITSEASATNSFQWKKNGVNVGSNSATYSDNTPSDGDLINCVVTSNNACLASNTAISNDIIMKVNPSVNASVSITPSANNICYGSPVTFTSTVTNGGANPQYTWYKNGIDLAHNSPTYTDNSLNDADYIMCTIHSDLACVANPIVQSNEIVMNVSPQGTPAVSIAASVTKVCQNTPVTFSATTINGGASPLYQWEKNNIPVGSNTNTYLDHNISNGDIISCILTSTGSCLSTSSASSNNIRITVVPDPSFFLPADTSICSYGSLDLKAKKSFNSYLWNTNTTNPVITINSAGIYWLEVTDSDNCKGRDTIVVNLKECRTGFYAPSAFTPNNDSKNDRFRPLVFGNVTHYKFIVYNRWGQIVFQTEDIGKAWDGTFAGRKQDSNVFIWTCAYQLEGEKLKVEKGTVMLIR